MRSFLSVIVLAGAAAAASVLDFSAPNGGSKYLDVYLFQSERNPLTLSSLSPIFSLVQRLRSDRFMGACYLGRLFRSNLPLFVGKRKELVLGVSQLDRWGKIHCSQGSILYISIL